MEPATDERQVGAQPELVTREFALVFAASFLFFASLYLLIPVLPLYMKEVAGATPTQVGLLMGAMLLASLAVRPLVGRKADTVGPKPLMMVGAADLIILSLVFIVTRALWSLPMALVIYGAGIACFHTTSLAFIGGIAPAARRGQSMAWFQSSFNLAIMLAPVAGEFLLGRYGFSRLFVSASAVASCSLGVLYLVKGKRVSTLVGGAVARPAFGSSRRLIALASVAVFSGTVTLGSVQSFIALFAEARRIPRFALFFTVQAAVLLCIRFALGWLPDRIGRKPAAVVSLTLLGASMLILASAESFATICIAAAVFGSGFAFLSPSLSALLIDRTPVEELGGAFGVFTAAFEGGIAFGSILLGPVISSLGYRWGFTTSGVISLAGAVFVLLAFPELGRPESIPASKRQTS